MDEEHWVELINTIKSLVSPRPTSDFITPLKLLDQLSRKNKIRV